MFTAGSSWQANAGNVSTGDCGCDAYEICQKNCRQVRLQLCNDQKFHLLVNDEKTITIPAYPQDLKALAYGYLFCEGLIRSLNDVSDFSASGPTICIRTDVEDRMRPAIHSCKVEVRTLYRCFLALDDLASIGRATGSVHMAAIFTLDGAIISFAEDVQQAASFYKAVGKAVIGEHDLSQCLILCTGRVFSDALMRARNVGISLVAGCGAPTLQAVETSRTAGITLICMPGLDRLMIYNGAERIECIEEERIVRPETHLRQATE